MAGGRQLSSMGQAFANLLGGQGAGAPGSFVRGGLGRTFGSAIGSQLPPEAAPPPAGGSQQAQGKWWLQQMTQAQRLRHGLGELEDQLVPVWLVRLAVEETVDRPMAVEVMGHLARLQMEQGEDDARPDAADLEEVATQAPMALEDEARP